MSAGRSHRRRAERWHERPADVELSADTRAWVAKMIAAHDDLTVTPEAFRLLGIQWAIALGGLPQAERTEAALQLSDHAISHLLGRRVRAVGTIPLAPRGDRR